MCAPIGPKLKGAGTGSVLANAAPPSSAATSPAASMRYTGSGAPDNYGPTGGDSVKPGGTMSSQPITANTTYGNPITVQPNFKQDAPTLGGGSPGVTTVGGRARKTRSFDTLRSGILSTVRSATQQPAGTVPFFAPSATANAGAMAKQKLGQ